MERRKRKWEKVLLHHRCELEFFVALFEFAAHRGHHATKERELATSLAEPGRACEHAAEKRNEILTSIRGVEATRVIDAALAGRASHRKDV